MYSRYGPMPTWMRVMVLVFFLLVFSLPLLQFTVGVAWFGASTAVVLAENAPALDDVQRARAMNARAEAAGLTLRVTPVEIAAARRRWTPR